MVRSKIKYKSPADRIFGAAIVLLSILVFAIVAYPLWFVLIASVSNSNLVNLGKVTIFPKTFVFMDTSRYFRMQESGEGI